MVVLDNLLVGSRAAWCVAQALVTEIGDLTKLKARSE